MPDNEVPDWMLSAMQEAAEQMRWAQPYVEQAQRDAKSIESMMPALRYAQQNANERRQALEVARSMAPIVEYMERHADQVRQALAAAEHLFAYADDLAIAAGLISFAVREVPPSSPRHWTASASLTVTPTLTVQAEVVKAESNDVDVRPDADPTTRRSIDYGALAIRLFWAFLMVMPLIAVRLSSEDQATIALYVALIGIGLIVTWRYNDTHKH